MTDPQLTLGLGLPEPEVCSPSARRDRLEEAVLAICDGFELRIASYYTHDVGFNRERRILRLAHRSIAEVVDVARSMKRHRRVLRRLWRWAEEHEAAGEAKLARHIKGPVGAFDWRPTHTIPEDFYA